MRVLVTGTDGFVGKNMAAILGCQPEWQIEGWIWNPDKDYWPNVKPYDWVVHLDSIIDTDIDQLLYRNFDFSCWLFTECQHHGVNLQYASSSLVYGNSKDCSEYSSCNPQSPFAWSKYLFDRWVFQQPQINYVQGFRYFNLYGKWMHLDGVHSNLIHLWRDQAKRTGKVIVPKGAETIKSDWTWVGDACYLHLDFINSVKGSGIWNVGSGLAHSFLDVAEEIAAQEHAEVVSVGEEPIKFNYANLKHLKETIGKRKWLNVYEWLETEA